ncbi:kinase-like domain-containing protein [Apiospora rasikravindrae]|uniref:Kinase-like domain-containing protein n=1 Tax=Apiospora rasikravindrae TaxID=990691 RepID=A0ABR1THQ1_9PEZI
MSLLQQSQQQILAYEQSTRTDNYRFFRYRRVGGPLLATNWNDPDVQAYVTPKNRTPDTQPPATDDVVRGAAGLNTNVRGRYPPSNPGAQELANRAQALRFTRAYFERAPRYLYRRVLGRGGQGTAFKMTYTVPASNAEINFVLKTAGLNALHQDIRREARMMEKLKRSAHCVQILHSSGKSRFDKPNANDSSDDPDEDSSGDDEDPANPPRPPRPARTTEQKVQAHAQKEWRVDRRMRLPNPFNDYTDAELELGRFDFIFMEYMELGSLEEVLFRFADDNQDKKIPNAVLWSFWLCMIRACVGMAYPPRKFHPDRNRARAAPRAGMEQSLQGIGLMSAFDPDMLLLEEMPAMSRREKRKRMVHFDIDPSNMFLGPALSPYRQNIPVDLNNNPVPNNQIQREINIQMEDGFPIPSDSLEHDLLPILKLGDFGLAQFIKPGKRNEYYRHYRGTGKWGWHTPEQFCSDWDYLPLTRDGREASQEIAAGNYDWHTNVWQIGLLIIRAQIPWKPRMDNLFQQQWGRVITNSYGILLDHDALSDVDLELRRTVCRCLKHDPRERPGLEELLNQAMRMVGQRVRGGTEQEIRNWVQTFIYNA